MKGDLGPLAILPLSEAELLRHARAARRDRLHGGSRQLVTFAELAELLGMERGVCVRALAALASRGELEVRAYPDSRLELRPAKPARQTPRSRTRRPVR